MIFVSVGTHSQPFTRLLKKIDELIEQKKITEPVMAQVGYSDYPAKNYPTQKFLGLAEFDEQVQTARIVITHGGEGNIGACLQHHKPMVIVPRLQKWGEHTNDHQLELTHAIVNAKKALLVLDIDDLEKAIDRAPGLVPAHAPTPSAILGLLGAFTRTQFEKRGKTDA